MSVRELSAEHYDILQILKFCKQDGTFVNLAFELHDRGGQTLMMALPALLETLRKGRLICLGTDHTPHITPKGELALATRKVAKRAGKLYFNGEMGINSLIPHSVCVTRRKLLAASVPRIMIRNWCRSRKMIEFKPECRFRSGKKYIKVRYGVIMECAISRDLIKKSEWSR